MIDKYVWILLFIANLAWAGLPPTSTKFSGDSNPVTTFEFDFPNATVTHTGTKASFGTQGVAGGGTGATSLTAYAVLAGGTTSTGAVQSVSGLGSSGQVLTSNGAGALPSWQPGAASSAIIASYYSNAASITPGGFGQINFNTSIIDTNSAVTTGATWKFTVPSTKNYDIKVMLRSTTSFNLYIYVNGSQTWTFSDGAGVTANGQYTYTATLPLTAGDAIDFRPSNGSVSFFGGSAILDTSVSIESR